MAAAGSIRVAARTLAGDRFSWDTAGSSTVADVAAHLVAAHGYEAASLKIVHRGQVLTGRSPPPELRSLCDCAGGDASVPIVVVGRRAPPQAPPPAAAPAAEAAQEEVDAEGEEALAAVLAEVAAGPTPLEAGLAQVPDFEELREAAAADTAELPALLRAMQASVPHTIALVEENPAAFVDIVSHGLPVWEDGDVDEAEPAAPAAAAPSVADMAAVASALLQLAQGPTELESLLGAVPVWESIRQSVQRGDTERRDAVDALRGIAPAAAEQLGALVEAGDEVADDLFAYPLPVFDDGEAPEDADTDTDDSDHDAR
eukprot:TRINITY_DN36513_c0_g1_i1.p1 TRINITY_DN36513_c0_g1~~TRINITY_DN36513_c0_g1_i1.p1  ORF type:complete len:315 (+),score=94.39 TRINITY_DN36513_c0_g1_i1:59-1003(+)